MHLSLHNKLFGAILFAIIVVIIYMAFLVQWSFDHGFLQYVNGIERDRLVQIARKLEQRYITNPSWESLKNDPEELLLLFVTTYPEGRQREHLKKRVRLKIDSEHGLPSGPLPAAPPVHFFGRFFLLDENSNVVLGFDPGKSSPRMIELVVENRVVGYVGVHPSKHLSDSHQLIFARQQKSTLLLVALGGFLIAAGLSLPLAYTIMKPVRKLAEATRNLTMGKYTSRIVVSSTDELGELSQDFNELAIVLEKNRQGRRKWIADISHELRTPLSILRGKIEALQDGLYSPEPARFAELHKEVSHLEMLVEDLYQLSLSDIGALTYRRKEVEPCWALEQAINDLTMDIEQKRLQLSKEIHCGPENTLLGDNTRLKQLFINLLSNSIRYTDEGGQLRITVTREQQDLVYEIEDSGPGVSEAHLEKLFDHLYRVEPSRSRKSGGAGLGLSICYNIVKGHQGTIEAHHGSLGGLLIRVHLPMAVF